MENQYEIIIKSSQIDNGIEYKPIYPLLQKYGIDLCLSCPYTSQMNGRVERRHRIIVKFGLFFS